MAEIDLHLAFDYMVENLNANMIMVDRDDVSFDDIEDNEVVRNILGAYAANEIGAFKALERLEDHYGYRIGYDAPVDDFADAWD